MLWRDAQFSTKSVTEAKSIRIQKATKMSQSVKLRVPKLVGSKWVYEYPVSKSAAKPEPEPNQVADWAAEVRKIIHFYA